MANVAELSCVYSSLILADDYIAITGEKLLTLIKAANVEIEPYWPGLFAKALEGVNIEELVTRLGSGVGTAPAAAAEAAPVKEEKKKEEEPEESDDDMGLGLFD